MQWDELIKIAVATEIKRETDETHKELTTHKNEPAMIIKTRANANLNFICFFLIVKRGPATRRARPDKMRCHTVNAPFFVVCAPKDSAIDSREAGE
jgi:hypothetical protein